MWPSEGMSSFSGSLNDLVSFLKPKWTTTMIEEVTQLPRSNNTMITDWFRLHPDMGQHFSFLLNLRLVIVQKISIRKRCVRLIYDGRYDSRISQHDTMPKNVVLDEEGRLQSWCHMTSDLPKLSVRKSKNNPYTPLWQLLQLGEPLCDPQNLTELDDFFYCCPVKENRCIYIFLTCITGRKRFFYCNRLVFKSGTAEPSEFLYLEARPGKRYGFMFRLLSELKGSKRVDPHQAADKSLFLQGRVGKGVEAKNRSSGLKTNHRGLNLALDLGLLSQTEFSEISLKLAKTTAALVLQYDELGHVRHLTYRDCHHLHCMEVSCRHENTANFNNFFHFLLERRKTLSVTREQILKPVLDKIRFASVLQHSPFAHCHLQLQECVRKQIVVLYCPDDKDLHVLKFPLAKFLLVSGKKKICRLGLQMSPKHDLIALNARDISIFNVAAYANLGKDPAFSALLGDILPIEHRKKTLQSHSKMNGNTMQSNCKFRGRHLANAILDFWTSFGVCFVSKFGLDIHSYPRPPKLSQLSFQAVYTDYAKRGGIYGHACEKLKPYYNELLRQHAMGGFMYSSCDRFESGQILSVNRDGEVNFARSISEFDINSSYGYAGSQALLPSGFCIGFFDPQSHPPDKVGIDDKEGGFLVRMDSDRSRSFEFRSVYYTLWKLSNQLSTVNPVVSVYSNFHPLGVFQIKKCILDLCVVLGDGSLLLFNFDSIFSHSCEHCPPLNRYINNQSHPELRQKARTRDDLVSGWIRESGLAATYQVISDCHDPEYTMPSLNKAFVNIASLKCLSQKCPRLKRLTLAKMQQWIEEHKQDRDFTFVCWMRGSLPIKLAHQFTPIVLQSKEKSLQGNRLHSCTEGKTIMITRDYYHYLVDKFQFEVEQIEAILFFSTNPHMNRVYADLVEARFSAGDPVKAGYLKSVSNMSVGFFGYNAEKQVPTYTLTNRFPQRATPATHQLFDLAEVKQMEDSVFFICQSHRKRRNWSNAATANNALSLHLSVVEYGKLRLVQFVNFLQKFLKPTQYKVVYSNIDNLQIILSANQMEDLISDDMRDEFCREKANFISDKKIPGMFKLEWQAGHSFKYASAFVQNYALLSPGANVAKWSGVNRIRPSETYKLSCDLLNKQIVCVTQSRRTDKLNSLEVEDKQLVFNVRDISSC